MRFRGFKNRGNVKKIYKVFSLFLCVVMLFGIFGIYNANAATHTRISESTASLIQGLDYGNVMDAEYAFTLQSTDDTTMEAWGYDEFVASGTRTDPTYNGCQVLSMMPEDHSLSGKMGVWFRNCGQYNGSDIDIKCTISWPDSGLPPLINAIIWNDGVYDGRGMLGFGFGTNSYQVTYELYSNSKPINVDMHLVFADIDAGQTFGFKMNSGSIDNIYYLNSYNGMSPTSYYGYSDGYHVFYSDIDYYSDDGLESSVMLEMSDTSSFNITFGAPYSSDYWNDISFGPSQAHDPYAKLRYDQLKPLFDSGDNRGVLSNCMINWAYFSAYELYGPYDLDITKTVTDDDETRVTSNTIYGNCDMTYEFLQFVPYSGSWTFDSYVVKDTLPTGVTYKSLTVYNEQGKEVTNLFKAAASGQTVSIRAVSPGDSSFYNHTYRYAVGVSVDVATSGMSFTNMASVTTQRNGVTKTKDSNVVKTTVPCGTGYLGKLDSQTRDRVEGAVYNVYTDSTCKTVAKDVYGNDAVFTTTKLTGSNICKMTPGTYYVKETAAPEGYSLSNEVYTLTITRGKTSYITVEDAKKGNLSIRKVSGNTDLTDGNSCYSLEGAVYGVYSDAACTKQVGTLKTDAEGKSNEIKLDAEKYYVKEVTASQGYKRCDGSMDGADDGIHEVTVEAGKSVTVECKEPPANNSFALLLQKLDAETGETVQGIASFEGAIFAVEYYTNTNGITDGDAFKTWYFQTDKDGYFRCSNPDYVADNDRNDSVSGYTMNDGTVLISDDLYKSLNGGVAYPVGTYAIYEISPPKYYQNVGYMQFKQNPTGHTDVNTGLKAVIKQAENGGEARIYDGENLFDNKFITAENLSINVFDTVRYGSITIYKQKSNGSKEPLQGVKFKLEGVEKGDEYIAETDADGKIVWDNLVPQDYVITEVETVDGYSLLKDNIEVKLPLEMTLDEISESGADISKAVYDEVSKKYCFYDLSYTVGNSFEFDMPIAGGDQNMLYIILIAGIAVVAIGIEIFSHFSMQLSARNKDNGNFRYISDTSEEKKL